MSTVRTTLTFALPEDQDSDQLNLYSSATRDGAYNLMLSTGYNYGDTEYQVVLDDTLYYRIEFENTNTDSVGPLSEAVFGGSFTNAAPFLAVSTRTDGANYASTQDVYEYSGLTPEDVSAAKISTSLRKARAMIDYRTAEMDLDRFDTFSTTTARRKYNATLRILKEAEINIALGNVYTNLSDDIIIGSMRGDSAAGAGSISIGGTSVQGDSLAERNENILYLAALADKYFIIGERLLAVLDANSIRLVPNELSVRSPRFRMPFNGF